MNEKKQLQMLKLIEMLRNDTNIESIKVKRNNEIVDVGLINQFKKHEVIPNKWFDWVNRVDANIMIIGQDWGPYTALKKYIDDYEVSKDEVNFNYDNFLFKTLSSRTEKFILKAVEQTYHEKYGSFDKNIFNDFFFTMAVLFTRQGIHFRGNHNFDEIKSFELSYPYVAKQIEIVKPKIIMSLGGLGFKLVNRYFSLDYDKKNVTQVIQDLGEGVIMTGNTVIIPNFHPASYIDPEIQMKIWKKLWTLR